MGEFDTDIAIIGSGFGGSVSALRLAEKGWKITVLEQGRQLSDADIAAAGQDPRKLAWMPVLGLKGFFAQDVFRHVGVVRGIGVGGGSNVYAAVLLEPKTNFYNDPAWRALSEDWQTELAPHYVRAKQMLGVVPNPHHGIQDDWLRGAAERMGAGATFDTVPQGIFFGNPDTTSRDPFFNGEGPDRTGCNQCGRCITGCAYGAKNTLERNYLYFARQKGVRVLPERQVTHIEPHPVILCINSTPGSVIRIMLPCGHARLFSLPEQSVQPNCFLPHVTVIARCQQYRHRSARMCAPTARPLSAFSPMTTAWMSRKALPSPRISIRTPKHTSRKTVSRKAMVL